MARVKRQKARKDYPAAGIKKGDMYYYTRIKTGPYSSREIRQLKPIRPSQMTTSDFLSRFYGLGERLSDYNGGIANLADELRGIAEEARELGQAEQEKYDNMPEPLQQGDTGMMIQERAEAMEQWSDSLDQAAGTAEEKANEFEENEKLWDEYDTAIAAHDEDADNYRETDVPEEPDDERMDEEDLVQEVIGEIEELLI